MLTSSSTCVASVDEREWTSEARRRVRSRRETWGGTSEVKHDVGEQWRSVVVVDKVRGSSCVGSRWIRYGVGSGEGFGGLRRSRCDAEGVGCEEVWLEGPRVGESMPET